VRLRNDHIRSDDLLWSLSESSCLAARVRHTSKARRNRQIRSRYPRPCIGLKVQWACETGSNVRVRPREPSTRELRQFPLPTWLEAERPAFHEERARRGFSSGKPGTGRQILQPIQRDFRTVLYSRFLKQPGHLNPDRTLRNVQLRLGKQSDQVILPARGRVAASRHNTVGQCLVNP
jgi:hypothetical protein